MSAALNRKDNYFAKIIREAQTEIATWSKERRESVQLEGQLPDLQSRLSALRLPSLCVLAMTTGHVTRKKKQIKLEQRMRKIGIDPRRYRPNENPWIDALVEELRYRSSKGNQR